MVMDGIFDPLHLNWIHRFFWNPVRIERRVKCRDLSIIPKDKALHAVGTGYTSADHTRISHFWRGVRGSKTRIVDRASNSNFSPRSCNSAATSTAHSNSGTAPPPNSATTSSAKASSPSGPSAADASACPDADASACPDASASGCPDASAASSPCGDSTSPSCETQGASQGSGICLQFRQRRSL